MKIVTHGLGFSTTVAYFLKAFGLDDHMNLILSLNIGIWIIFIELVLSVLRGRNGESKESSSTKGVTSNAPVTTRARRRNTSKKKAAIKVTSRLK